MRILIYGINYLPELTGVGKYTGEMAEWLASQGHQVRVVTAPPYYPAWKISEGYSRWAYTHEHRGGVEVFRCPIWVKEQPSGVERLAHLLSFALSSLWVMLTQVFWRPEVVLSVEPPLMAAPVALLVARLGGARSWLHIQDFEVDAAFELESLPRGGFIQRVAESFEAWLMSRFDRVSTISQQMLERAVSKGVEREQVRLLPNWVDTDLIFPSGPSHALRSELGLSPDDLVVLYSGNMGGKQGLGLLVEVAERLQNAPNIRFVLCGNGTARLRLEQDVTRRGLTNVQFLPLQPVERLGELLNLADIHALIQRDAPADLVMPSKLGGMMASGRAIVATARAGTAIATILGQARCGHLVTPEDPAALERAIRRLANDPRRRAQMGSNGRRWAVQHLAREVVFARLTDELTMLNPNAAPLPSREREPVPSLPEPSGTLRTADVDEVV